MNTPLECNAGVGQIMKFCLFSHTALFFSAPILGHVGDGNLHCNILFDPNPSSKDKDPIR